MLASTAPEILIAAIAAGDRAHPRRQRRRDAAALQPVQGRRDVQHPQRAARRPHRPRRRPRAGHRSRDDVRAPARPPPDVAGRLPRAARRAARVLRGRLPGRPPLRPARRRCPGAPGHARRLAARLVAAERDLGRRARPALLGRRLHQPASGAENARLYRERFAPSRRRAQAEDDRRASRRSAPRPTRRPSGSRRAADGDHAAAPRAADRRCRRSRRRCAFLDADGRHRPAAPAAGAPSSARPDDGARRARGGRGASTAPTR